MARLGPGVTIDKYQLLEPLGAGGMGIVYEALDTRLSRRVAIKFVANDRGRDRSADEERRRLLREARAMARLDHPNVVTIYESGICDGHVYVVMELLEGGSLSRRFEEWHSRGDAVPWRTIVDTFLHAGEGLAVAHDAGLVHRDCKPDNILIGKDGRVAVADFGIVGSSRDAGADANAATALTTFGELAGTPAYMAPEQYAGDRVDGRADQFAFCASLYEALYGQLPFDGNSRDGYREAVAAGTIRQPPDDSAVPFWVFELLRRGMSSDPADRFPSMRDLLRRFHPKTLQLEPRLRLIHYLAAAAIIVIGVLGSGPADYGRMAIDHLIGGGFLTFSFFLRRKTLLSTRFNRTAFSILGLGLVVDMMLLAAAYRLGIDAHATRALIPLGWVTVVVTGVAFNRGLVIPAIIVVSFAAMAIHSPAHASAAMAACISVLLLLVPHALRLERAILARFELNTSPRDD